MLRRIGTKKVFRCEARDWKVFCMRTYDISYKERTVNALAPEGEEGRGQLR